VVIHNDEQALSAAGLVPLVISGHGHIASARAIEGTLFLRTGTTGGSGLGVFSVEEGIPLSAQVLHFQTDGSLLGYDVIEQSAETGSVTLDRHVVALDFPEPQPEPDTAVSAPLELRGLLTSLLPGTFRNRKLVLDRTSKRG
jgi:hypothetical protein